ADMDLDVNLVPLPGSPAENAGRSLPGGFPDSNTAPGANDDSGAFPVGSTPGADWPRTQSQNAWVTTLPANWTSPGVGGGSSVAVLDAISADEDSSSPPSRTFSAGSDRLVGLLIWGNGTTDTISAVSYGGQAMTQRVAVASAGGFPARAKIWTIGEAGIAAASGNTFGLTGSLNGRIRFGTISWENINQASPIVDSGSGADNGGNPANVILNTEDGGYALAIATQDFDGGTCVWGSDLTELVDLITTGGTSISIHAAGATTDGTTVTADPTTSGSPTQQCQAAISLRKA
ncbi:MAG: hypothetical protein ACR2Q4_14690, partial [Geminicoccaceae bacterium]